MLENQLPPRKLLPPVPLRIQQRGEVAVIDPHRCRGGDRGLGVVGDAEAGVLDHAEIVGAVADHEGVEVVEIEGLAQLDQGGELGGAAEDRLGDLAGQFAILDPELIGAVLLKSDCSPRPRW